MVVPPAALVPFRGDPVRQLRSAIIVVAVKARRQGTAIDVHSEAVRLFKTYPTCGLTLVEVEILVVRIAALNQCKIQVELDGEPAN